MRRAFSLSLKGKRKPDDDEATTLLPEASKASKAPGGGLRRAMTNYRAGSQAPAPGTRRGGVNTVHAPPTSNNNTTYAASTQQTPQSIATTPSTPSTFAPLTSTTSQIPAPRTQQERLFKPLPAIPQAISIPVKMPPPPMPNQKGRRHGRNPDRAERAEQAVQRELQESSRITGRARQTALQEREDRWAAEFEAIADSIDMPVGEPKLHNHGRVLEDVREEDHEDDYEEDCENDGSDADSDVTATYWTTARKFAPVFNPNDPPRIHFAIKPFEPEAFRRGSAPGATSLPAPRHALLYRKPVAIKRAYLAPVYFNPKGKGKAEVFAYGNRDVRPGSIAAELNSRSSSSDTQARVENRIEDTLTLLRSSFKDISLASDIATQADPAKRNVQAEKINRNPLPAPAAGRVQYSFVPSSKDIKRLLNTIGYVIIQQVFEHPKATEADIVSCLELEDFFAYVMSFGHQDRAAIMANNTSLRIIKNELEGLLLRDAITDGQYGEIMLKLPSEQPLGGPQAAPGAPAAVVNGMPPPSYVQATPGQPTLPARRATDPPKEQEIDEAVALYDYKGDAGDCNFKGGDRIAILEYCNPEWCKGRNKRTGECGLFPFNYVRVEKQVPQYDGPAYSAGPAPVANPYNAPVPPMAVANNEGEKGSKGSEMGKKVGKKLGNAAIFGAGATIGSNLVNSIF